MSEELIGAAYTAAAGLHGISATYTRGVNSASLTLLPAVRRKDGDQGVVALAYESRDFLAKAEELLFGETAFTPARGDRITVGTLVYEVMPPPGTTATSYEMADPYGAVLRIHTRRVT